MNKLVVVLALVLAACTEPVEERQADQCLRRELFQECLAAVPQGPTHTAGSNDWDEVIAECRTTAYYMSNRPKYMIKEECQ